MREIVKLKSEEKGQLRKLALSRRNALSSLERKAAEEKIAAKLLKHPALERANIVMCYKSIRSELPTDALIQALESRGKTLCYPVCGKLGVMQAYSPVDNTAWKHGMMGIVEPDVENSRLIAPEDIDLVICPMVAFDHHKQRMGYGAGYYDRYLPRCKNAFVMGIAFEAQRMDNIITDEYDIAMNAIITEENEY